MPKRNKWLRRKRGSPRQRGKVFPVKPATGSLKARLPKVGAIMIRRFINLNKRTPKREYGYYVIHGYSQQAPSSTLPHFKTQRDAFKFARSKRFAMVVYATNRRILATSTYGRLTVNRGGAASMDLPWWNWQPEHREKDYPQSVEQQKTRANLSPRD
jgi:hypothetical protein